MPDIPDLVCFDLPCLVNPCPGTAQEALDRALRRVDVEKDSDLYRHVLSLGLRWPGTLASAALREALGSPGWAAAAAAAFDDAFGAAASRRGVAVVDGAAACIAQLRAMDARICLTTEFSATTREAILDVVDWPGLVAMLLSPGSCGRADDVVLRAAIDRAGAEPRHTVVVASSTTAVAAGRRAGLVDIVGVPTLGASARDLRQAGATRVRSLPQLAGELAAQRLVPA